MKFPFFTRKSEKPKATPRPKKRKVVARYDFAQTQNDNGGTVRRPARIETGAEETQQGGGLTITNRLKAINLVRDLMRNSPLLRTDINALQLNTIGTNADLMFYDKPEDWYRQAEKAWRKWSKHASFRDNGSLVEFLDKLLYTLLAEGDCVVMFDGGDIEDSGKVLMFGPDQICPLDANDFAAEYSDKGYTQADGIIRDQYGRTIGVVISQQPGLTTVRKDNALVLMKDDPYETGSWIYVKRSYRDTARGVADALPILADLQDVSEILQYEKISAKRFAAQYAYISEAPQESAVTPEGFIDDDAEQTEGQTEADEEYTVEHLQDVTAGMLDLLPNGSSIQFAPNDRPSPRTLEYVENVREICGGALGLTRSFSLSKADTSYTAARWDSGIASRAFAKLSQFLDDYVLDWMADRVINWLIGKGKLEKAPDADWAEDVAFTHPSAREVLDEAKIAAANETSLKTGTKNLSELIGPHWRKVLEQLAEEKRYAESLGLNLSFGESGNGVYVRSRDIIENGPEDTEE